MIDITKTAIASDAESVCENTLNIRNAITRGGIALMIDITTLNGV